MQYSSSQPAARRTSPRVRLVDAAMKTVVTIGGLGVIVAVLTIMAYLALTAWPLLTAGSANHIRTTRLEAPKKPVALMLDEYQGLAGVLEGDGIVRVWSLNEKSKPVEFSIAKPDGRTITAMSTPTEAGVFAVGYDDGTVQTATFEYHTEFINESEAPPAARSLRRGERQVLDVGGYIERTPLDQLRVTRAVLSTTPPTALSRGEGAVVRLDLRASAGSQYLVAIRTDGTGVFNRVTATRPLGGGAPKIKLVAADFDYREADSAGKFPDWLYVTADGSHILCLWQSGQLSRYARKPGEDSFVLAETVSIVEAGRTVTSAAMLLGAKTLMIGDDKGRVIGCFAARQGSHSTVDGDRFVVAHQFDDAPGSPVVALACSQRDRSFLAVNAAGECIVRHMTSEKTVARTVPLARGEAVTAPILAAVAPKLDGFATLRGGDSAPAIGGDLELYKLAPGYPESSASSLFGRVWYEGDGSPQYVYQSSAGEDTAETKYSMIPLIFGTLKATLYSMLFAAPLAILAAIYSSEILHPKVRNRVKPAIEMMASLPSVVLGFLAAMIIAPWARDALPGILLAFFVVPTAALLGAYLWQLLPTRTTATLSGSRHFALVAAVLAIALGLASACGPLIERVLFTPSTADQLVLAGAIEPVPRDQWPEDLRASSQALSTDALALRRSGLYQSQGLVVRAKGDVSDPAIAKAIAVDALDEPSIRRWLDGSIGSAFPGWLLVLTPVGVGVMMLMRVRLLDPFVDGFGRVGTPAALAQLARFAITLAGGIAIAAALAGAFGAMGLDARESILGPFSQRNTLIVSIVMGFAIIPIIYTISEDALSAVPGSLRSASLGCGATRWQTAIRVVMPIAASGIFSACMIGLGRAAGETMIVVMATGNTPSMDWNIFSGFRTLSANIAVEMPEAVEGAMHYRVLFLGGLCLFAFTFVINTAAELVRQRFRRRSAAL